MLKKMKCPVCLKKSIIYTNGKNHVFPNGYSAKICDCIRCKARYVLPYKAGNVHEEMHSNANENTDNYYGVLVKLGQKCSKAYQEKDSKAYYQLLKSNSEKFQFIIDYITKNFNTEARLLEVGCAEGYLTGYFKLKGYDIYGTDISKTAIDFCKENYGDYFFAGDIREIEKQEYDVIYHVGMIGCLDFPKEFLNKCIDLLKPGGVMIFNAPNRWRTQDKWSPTSPPDLRTLFAPETFWCLLHHRRDIKIEAQYSIDGKAYNMKHGWEYIVETLKDYIDYKCYTNRNTVNMYLIIKKR